MSEYKDAVVIEQDIIKSPFDLMNLCIIDFARTRGNQGKWLEFASGWLINTVYYTILKYDLRQAPEYPNWPEWEHVGDHKRLGKLFWNDFNWKFHGTGSELWFDDSPDFSGTMRWEDRAVTWFQGDIGKCSPAAFCTGMKQLRSGDIWISVLSDTKQVVLEPFIDIMGDL